MSRLLRDFLDFPEESSAAANGAPSISDQPSEEQQRG